MDVDAVLAFEYDRWDLGKCSIRHYLVELAKQCWLKEESFGGKRPFGNSGWTWDVYGALVEGGFVTGTTDEYGCLEEFDCEKADQIILACFAKLQGDDGSNAE